MDFLSGLAKGGGDSKKPAGGEEKFSTADILADAKTVAEAARAQFSNQPEKCDKAKAAGSAADLLDAAENYAKLDETKGVGKYAEQAEGYLRQYSAPKSAAAAGEVKPAPTTAAAAAETEIPSGGGAGDYVKKAEEFVGKPSEGGGSGDYMKKAEEFFSKPAEGGEKGEAEGGYGGLMKAAGGFFNK